MILKFKQYLNACFLISQGTINSDKTNINSTILLFKAISQTVKT